MGASASSDVATSLPSQIEDIIGRLSKDQLSLPGVSEFVDTVLTLTKKRNEVCHLHKSVATCQKAYLDLTNAIKKADDGLEDYALGTGCKVGNSNFLVEDVVLYLLDAERG